MKLLTLAPIVLLAGCGSAAALKPGPSKMLPPKPYGATAVPTAKLLVTPSSQARPERSDELLKSSEERRGDEFTLPPPN
ncbi:MAG: hypothetical protein K2W81_01360 [Sphingomonas sp.]|uniref:hypothetical protein n=1 Tax=Sphingomonas sp. TaxID=28214 RepID=UPI0025CD8037|nr:hypothetical protein [Sphingomonas sp.]MBY0282592.1 hypothetical protein [Sphingomonas sp.]